MSDRYNLPADTADFINDHIERCKNLALILDKYPPAYVPGDSEEKSKWLKHLKPNDHIDTALTQSAYNRWFSMISAMGVTSFYAILDWHMVIGLGGERVLETDITLHHLYGIPFIPGSALKGLTRAYVSAEYKQYYIPENQPEDQRKPSKKTDEDHSEIKRIFGTQERAGTVIFFDAMPLPGTIIFVLDIMNSHYPDYYKSLKSEKITAPTNDQQPNPITFLAVKSTTFAFALAPRDASKARHVKDVEDVKGWLLEALQKYGVGGKTSAGYGYFKEADDKDTVPVSSVSVQTAQKPEQPTTQENWQRPNIPHFREGQEIQNCVVIQPAETMRRFYPTAGAFLRYREFPTTYAYIVIEEAFSEGQQWQPNNSRTCIFIREEQREGSLVLVCKAKPPKEKKK